MLALALLSFIPFVLSVPTSEHIIGGSDVTSDTKWPWQGSLERFGSHSCGCVLIHQDWIISAAHCLEGEPSSYSVRFGSATRGTGDLYQISNVIQHENYEQGTGSFPNDVGLLQPSRSVDLSSTVQVIAIDSPTASESNCAITGWGDDGSIGLPTTLQEAQPMEILSDAQCAAEWGNSYNGNVHVCVQDLPAQKMGACSGDSGGPLVCQVGTGYELRGVTSWGHRTCDPVWPSVYTRLTTYIDWVCDNTNRDVC